MSDGLILNDEKNNSTSRGGQPPALNSGGYNAAYTAPPTYDQAAYGSPNPQGGYYPVVQYQPQPSPYPSPYGVSPLQPSPVPGAQNIGYFPQVSNPPYQYPYMYPPGQGGSPQTQFMPPQQPQYGQMNYQQYGAPPQQQLTPYSPGYQQQPFYGSPDQKQQQPVYGGPDLKQPQQTQVQPVGTQNQVQPPPQFLSSAITNVPFNPVHLNTEDQSHAIKAILKAGAGTAAIVAIVGTYLAAKHIHERNRLQQSNTDWDHPHRHGHSTQDVAIYDAMMNKLEGLSGHVLTNHHGFHHKGMDAQQWTEALNPHRRAIFANLYNSNPNVRGFCGGLQGGPEAYPVLDEWALGTRKHNLSFQRAIRQAPNWNVARELLSQVRTVILLDDSGSMAAPGHSAWGGYNDNYGAGGRNVSRWDQARNLIAGITPLVSRYNRHGVDVHFLNHYQPIHGMHTSQDVHNMFKHIHPSGGTPTGRRINELLDGYMCALRYNRSIMPLNLVVITDGEAQDESRLHWAIEEHVTKIVHRGFQPHQFGIEFLQVGDDWEATRHLEKLEEEISRHHENFQRDIIGITPATRQSRMNPDQLLAITLSGIDARMNGYMRHRGWNV